MNSLFAGKSKRVKGFIAEEGRCMLGFQAFNTDLLQQLSTHTMRLQAELELVLKACRGVPCISVIVSLVTLLHSCF